MKTIWVRLKERSYPIGVGAPLAQLGTAVRRWVRQGDRIPRRALVACNPQLEGKYARPAAAALERVGIAAELAVLPEGERNKNLKTVEQLYRACVRHKLDRSSCIVAVGGGVVGDVAGFAAATYLRGIAVVHAPTTLLAMVDSSIGGKTGVDLPEAKNFVGAFHQPRLVWIDVSALKTLPPREFRNGLAEVIKYGVISDAKLFELLEKEVEAGLPRRPAALARIIAACAAIKADVVSRDERETRGLRDILNFGHTFGHAIETVTGYNTYKHGEAISIGMAAAGRMAEISGLWKAADQRRMERLLAQAGLPLRLARPLPSTRVFSALARDKKNVAGELRFVLPNAIGKVVVRKVPFALAERGWACIQPKKD